MICLVLVRLCQSPPSLFPSCPQRRKSKATSLPSSTIAQQIPPKSMFLFFFSIAEVSGKDQGRGKSQGQRHPAILEITLYFRYDIHPRSRYPRMTFFTTLHTYYTLRVKSYWRLWRFAATHKFQEGLSSLPCFRRRRRCTSNLAHKESVMRLLIIRPPCRASEGG